MQANKNFEEFLRVILGLFILFLPMGRIAVFGAPSQMKEETATMSDSVSTSMEVLLLPEIPATLHDPRERAGYLLQHFWDGMDFQDTLRSHNRGFIEQNLVDFMSLLPHADTVAIVSAIQILLQRAGGDKITCLLMIEIIEKYLYEIESPLYDEEYYCLFLENMRCATVFDATERLRFNYQLRMLRKNCPGTQAADFGYIDRNGYFNTLYETQGNLLLLLFYDPDCEHCGEIIHNLHMSSLLQKLISDKKINVLAIYTEGDREIWENTKTSMPQEWNVGFDIDRILELELYFLPTMPGLYLLNSEKKVLLKGPSLTILESFLHKMSFCGE